MKPLNRKPLRIVSELDKAELDDQTPYTTFLPPMSEGFHIGYKPAPGILKDDNQKPGEWLENFARYMRTQGEDVGYAIPDVLASEQQLRRLSRLPQEMAMRHQEMVDYRAILTLLLLWDFLALDPTASTLTLESLRVKSGQGGFSQAVHAALPVGRAEDGLQVFTLLRPQSENPEKTPLCLLSKAMVLMPAANLADLSELLPPAVAWYDRQRKRFNDPCPYLDEEMRSLLIPRLRFLQMLNDSPAAGSILYTPEAHLCALIDRLIADILAPREEWREQLIKGDEAAERALRTRLLVVYGLAGREHGLTLTEQTLHADAGLYWNNPLLRTVAPEGVKMPSAPGEESAVLYLLDGVPFARRSGAFLLEPAMTAGEAAALKTAGEEIALLDSYDEGWREAMAELLGKLAAELEGRTGVHPALQTLLRRWQQEYLAYPRRGERELVLRCPEDTASRSLSPLLTKIMGRDAEACVRTPFSDCLLLIGNGDAMTMHGTLAPCKVSGEALFFVPPLSPEMAGWLQCQGEQETPLRPRLTDDLSCTPSPGGNTLEVRFSILCPDADGGTPSRVSFVRAYTRSVLPECGAAFTLPAASLPSVTLWPNVRLASSHWRQYFLHTHRPEALSVWALSSSGWLQGELHSAQDVVSPSQRQAHSWRTALTDRFPAFVALKRGALSVGVLVNDQPRKMLRHEAAAVVAMDFGSIATTLMLRQGDKVQPAALPEGLHGTLLTGVAEETAYLTDELLPKGAFTRGAASESTFYSVMDMFTDDPGQWQAPLLDGHIYYPESLSALLKKGEDSLYYDLKWSEEHYALRCLRLFLKQAMLQASLAARLWGSGSVSWRVSMPSALPLHRQEAYLDMVRGLAHELAKECGLPLNDGCPPVLHAVENQADGLYFRSRNEVNARSGYLNLDIGGSTADLSLWLSNAIHATAECSLLLGCRQILFASIESGHADAFEQDFSASPIAHIAAEICRGIRQDGSTTRGRQKSMLLMDDFFAAYAGEIRDVMTAVRAQGRVSYVESLLLFNIGFLFHLAGLLLQRAYEDDGLRPLLPRRMELCVAGNGGQLLKAFTPEQTESLCRLTLAALCPEHPVQAILTVQSVDPKREVALGLLHDEGTLQSTLHGVDRWNGTFVTADEKPVHDDTIAAYLLRFYQTFPQAANLLFPDVYEANALRGDACLAPTAKMELETILHNERDKTPDDDFSMWVRCFVGLKRLWSSRR